VEIIQPRGEAEVSALLFELGPSARIHAGGTDLVLQIRHGLQKPQYIIDLSRIDPLRRITSLDTGNIWIGAMATLQAVARHASVAAHFTALSEAAGSVGSVQIRNRGTVVGNVCNASPAADTVPALLLFDARIHIIGPQARRMMPIGEFITGPGQTGLSRGEFVLGIELPKNTKSTASVYLKLSRRRRVDLAIVSVGAFVSSEQEVRLAFGAVAPVPFRAKEAEEILSGRATDTGAIEDSIQAIKPLVNPITDVRASTQYRAEMSHVMARRALALAASRMDKAS
jgi:carbon-monoxide dehydrogenase medium subunit